MSSRSKPTRRNFLSSSAAIAAAGTIGTSLTPKPAYGFHNSVDDELRIGLVGCGGRGTAAVVNALKGDSNSRVTALADAFPDRIASTLESLNAAEPKRMSVDKEHQFSGPLCHE